MIDLPRTPEPRRDGIARAWRTRPARTPAARRLPRGPDREAAARGGGAVLAVAAAVGLLVGARAVLSFELRRPRALLSLDPLPRERLGLRWSQHALWPADVQAAGLDALVTLLAGLALGGLAIATLNALVLLTESASSRRSELAVRAAMGATRTTLAGMLLHELRRLVVTALALGGVLGLAAGGVARAAWPGRLERLAEAPALAQVAPGLALLMGLLALAYVRSGLRAARPEAVASVLRAGGRTSDDPMAICVRKVLGATHLALAGGVVVGALTLAGALGTLASAERIDAGSAVGGAEVPAPASRTAVIEATAPAPGRWTNLFERLRAIPGIEAESLATPGALVGLGVRDFALAECGRCTRGLMPAPLWSAVVDHHAVTPGYFELAGIDVVDGRAILPSDGPGAEPVALVSRSFAYSSFEDGDPVGKRVRLGTGLHDWYLIVGVVEDLRVPVLGADDLPPEAIYVSALQRPPRAGTVLVRGEPSAVREATALLERLGFAPGPPRSLGEHRLARAAPLAWARGAAIVLALAALLLGAHGVYTASLQTTRRRARAIAIRMAAGARTRHVLTHVLGERMRTIGWGLAGMLLPGTLVVGLLRKTAGMSPLPPEGYAGVAALLAVTGLAASLRAAREALRVEPAALLE